MTKGKFKATLAALAIASMGSTPAFAGEVTGTGAPIDAGGRSICKFSGLNDGLPPPGRTQSFGHNVVNGYPLHDPVDPTSHDPDGGFNLHPGWYCNPNNVDASEF